MNVHFKHDNYYARYLTFLQIQLANNILITLQIVSNDMPKKKTIRITEKYND